MALTRCVVLAALFAGAAATDPEATPVSKVTDLIEGLKTEVEQEGAAEASAYNKFACFCKDTTKTKSDSVIKGNENIDVLSADIAKKTADRKDDLTEVAERKKEQEHMTTELEEAKTRCSKETAVYEAAHADLSKAVSSLQGAIKAMSDTKPAAASLLELQAVVDTLTSSHVAKTMPSAQKAISTLLLQTKVDPENAEYAFHSQDIVELCDQLLGQFRQEKHDLETEYEKTSKACEETIRSIGEEMTSNKGAMDALVEEAAKLAEEIAGHREDLVQADGDMKDDELYLKDLTKRCEDRSHDYDQRSETRAQEIQALSEAVDALNNKVKSQSEVNKRALFIQEAQKAQATEAKEDAKAASEALSFVQASSVKAHSFLARASTDLELEAKKNKALDMLRNEAQRIGSVTIAALTTRVASDPFKKVNRLIQKLIERLLEESKNEATKKGFCDEAVGKAEHNRNNHFEQARDLSRELGSLEAKEDELTTEIDELTKSIESGDSDLKKSSEDRKKEKDNNIQSIATAKDGLAGVKEALLILKSFYSNAAKGAAFVQASPVDEDTAGPGFEGNYKGKQGGMKAVFALLEVLASDFDRTLRTTEEAENKAHREFVEFQQTGKSDVAGKTTKRELDEQDLRHTKTDIKRKSADMQSQTDLTDEALKELEVLKPQCIDTGMSYADRVAKREEEIQALQNALEILK